MSEIGYKAWGLIPVDDAPTSTIPSVYQPPMLVNLALDSRASLVFQLSRAVDNLHVRFHTTAVSADQEPEQRGEQELQSNDLMITGKDISR